MKAHRRGTPLPDAAPASGRTPAEAADHEAVARVTAAFRDMPGLSVTLTQAARFFDLPRDECRALFEELQRQGVVQITAEGEYRTPPGE